MFETTRDSRVDFLYNPSPLCLSLACWLTLVQFRPPLSDRKTPPSDASTRAQARSGLAGETAMPIRPSTPFGSPGACEMSDQVSPPSVDLKMPLPVPPLSK